MTIQSTHPPAITTRSGAIDAIRVLGVLAVIAGHVEASTGFRMALYTWHVPIFFFLTGYLWTAGRSLSTELSKRSKTLLIPYAAWLALISIPFAASLFVGDGFGLKDAAKILLGGSYVSSPFSAFWFVTALFVAALLFRVIERLPQMVQWVIVAAALAVAYVFSELVAAIPFSAGVAVPCMVFMLAGYALKAHRKKIVRPLWTGAGMLAVSAVLILTKLSAPLDLKQADFGTPVLSIVVAFLMSAGLVLIAESLVPKIGAKANGWITRIALGGFMVVLTHSFFIWILGDFDTNGWIVFAVATALPWTAAMVLLRTPISHLFLGVRQVK